MGDLLLATLGQRPEAITMALQLLGERYTLDGIAILHTEPHHSQIATALTQLRGAMAAHFPQVPAYYREIAYDNGDPLLDIADWRAADHYFRAVYGYLREYKQTHGRLHLLVSGGRKAMSVYASFAATLVFGSHDKVWVILSPESLLQSGQFTVPSALKHAVHMVELPTAPARQVATHLPQDPQALIQHRRHPRERFLQKVLSPQERVLVEVIQQHPYDGAKEWAAHLSKSKRTVENQLQAIYQKLNIYIDFAETVSDKKQLLLDLLLERL